jgi:uncharacterized membrane protein
MEKIQFTYLLLALLGAIIHKCFKVLKATKKAKEPFSFRVFLKDRMNYVRLLLTVASVLALMLMADDVSHIFGITLKDGSTAKSVTFFLIGYLNSSLIRNLLKVFKKRIKDTE